MSKKEFILANKGKMRPIDMAKKLNCSKAYVSIVLRPRDDDKGEDYFNIKEFSKYYSY